MSHRFAILLVVTFWVTDPVMATDPTNAGATNDLADLSSLLEMAEPEPVPMILTEPGAVLEPDQLVNSHLESLRDLTACVPNLAVTDGNGDRSPRFAYRGLRENNFAAGESLVGVYLDDVPLIGMHSRAALLYDAAEVEFLPDARGLALGSARPGGMIRITTQQPGNEWHGAGRLSYGNHEAVSLDGHASGPVVTNQLFFGVSALYSERAGYFENTFLGTHPDDRQTLAGRMQLLYRPGEPWTFSLTASGERDRDGYIPAVDIASSDPFSIQRDYDGKANTDSINLAFKALYEQPAFRGVSVTSYRNWRQDILQDYDFSPAPIRLGFTQPHLRQIAEELRFHSGDTEARFKWNGGAFFADHSLDGESGSEELQAGGRNRTTYQLNGQDYALFGQGTYQLLDQLELTGGVRFELDDRRMTRSHVFETALGSTQLAPDFDLSDQWNSINPNANLRWRFSPSADVYASVVRGFQSGGFNPASDNPAELRYDSSESWTYELGGRVSALDDRLVMHAAVFYIDVDNYQVFRPTPTLTAFNYQMMNAARAHSMGGELGAAYSPIDRLKFDAVFGYAHAEFDEFVDPFSGADFGGNRVNLAPELTATIGVQYKCSFGLLTRIETQIVGDTFLDEANTIKQPAYALVNAQIGYEKDWFGIHVFGRNLTDERYFNNALDFGVDTGGRMLGVPGDPITYGVMFTGRF
ncbi:hypothetical protein GC207_10555 [bacterium]|nr:hypothetical protein [bacterium]